MSARFLQHPISGHLQSPIANRRWDTYMVVIVSVSKLHNGRIQVAVAKPQHNSKPVQSYVSEEEAREVLLGLGVADETADYYLFKLFPQLSANQELTFSPMDVPQHELLSRGFEM